MHVSVICMSFATAGISHPKVEHLILFLHRGQKCVLGKIIRMRAVLFIRPLDLLLQRLDAWGQEPSKFKVSTLFVGEG